MAPGTADNISCDRRERVSEQAPTSVDPKSDVFMGNSEAYEELLLELRERSAEARRGGGEGAQRRQKSAGSCRCATG